MQYYGRLYGGGGCMKHLEGVIFDWAGTTVDFGCFAPVQVFVEVFNEAGIEVTVEEARKPMGMLKIDHIRTMMEMPRISALWNEKYGRHFNEQDVLSLYSMFEPSLMTSISKYTDPIPGVIDVVSTLRAKGLKIGSTTGYTDSMMEVVTSQVKAKGYAPDYWVTADSTSSYGRPYPYMIFRNMETLKLSVPSKVVKVGDTSSDILEGLHAGVWSVGVIIGSSQMGLSLEEYEALAIYEKEEKIKQVEEAFLKEGAHFTIRSMEELPELLEKIDLLLEAGLKPNQLEVSR